MIDAHQALRMKTELLCKGLYLDENLIDHYNEQGISIDYGRKGGAGPSGGRYFLLEDKSTLINVALWNNPSRTELFLKEHNDGFFEVFNENSKETFGRLKLIQNPKFYPPRFAFRAKIIYPLSSTSNQQPITNNHQYSVS